MWGLFMLLIHMMLSNLHCTWFSVRFQCIFIMFYFIILILNTFTERNWTGLKMWAVGVSQENLYSGCSSGWTGQIQSAYLGIQIWDTSEARSKWHCQPLVLSVSCSIAFHFNCLRYLCLVFQAPPGSAVYGHTVVPLLVATLNRGHPL